MHEESITVGRLDESGEENPANDVTTQVGNALCLRPARTMDASTRLSLLRFSLLTFGQTSEWGLSSGFRVCESVNRVGHRYSHQIKD